MFNNLWSRLVLAFAIAGSAAPVSATFVLGSTFDANTQLTLPVPTFRVMGAAEAARDLFLTLLPSHQTESVDGLPTSYPTGDPTQGGSQNPPNPGSLSLFSGAASLKTPIVGNSYGTNVAEDAEGARVLGRWDTTTYHAPIQASPTYGGKFLDSTGGFEIQFTNAIRAFGVFITDAGDFLWGLSVCFSDASDPECNDPGSVSLVVISPDSSTIIQNGALRFVGYVNSDIGGDFKVVRFSQSPPIGGTAVEDGIGYDDLIIGQFEPNGGNVPEPGTLTLLCVALFAAGAARRRVSR